MVPNPCGAVDEAVVVMDFQAALGLCQPHGWCLSPAALSSSRRAASGLRRRMPTLRGQDVNSVAWPCPGRPHRLPSPAGQRAARGQDLPPEAGRELFTGFVRL